jgi:hypothetical protein
MDEMIDFLRNTTQLSRFSRGEVRDFLERLAFEGYEITSIIREPKPVEIFSPIMPADPEDESHGEA